MYARGSTGDGFTVMTSPMGGRDDDGWSARSDSNRRPPYPRGMGSFLVTSYVLMVREMGFEPTTSRFRNARSGTRLSYSLRFVQLSMTVRDIFVTFISLSGVNRTRCNLYPKQVPYRSASPRSRSTLPGLPVVSGRQRPWVPLPGLRSGNSPTQRQDVGDNIILELGV